MYEVKDLVLAGTIAMIKHTILQGQNTCLNAKVHQVHSRLADGSQALCSCASLERRNRTVCHFTLKITLKPCSECLSVVFVIPAIFRA